MLIPDLILSSPWLLAIFIIVSRILDVSIGTMRTTCVVRGYRMLPAVLGFCEVLIWIVAVAGVLNNPTPLTVVAYGVGFALGNFCGVTLENKLALGYQMITLLSRSRSHTLAFGLRMAGFTVTEVTATGRDGEIDMVMTVVARRRSAEVIHLAESLDSEVFITVQDVRPSPLQRESSATAPTGWRAIMKRK